MQYSSHILVKTYILIFTATWGSCWQFFTSISDITLSGTRPDPRVEHSEYDFGKCKSIKEFYSHIHLNHIDILGKTIVRGWIDVLRIPTCIIMRATSYDLNTFQSTSFAFQMCVPRITYCYTHRRFKLYYFEWYIPTDYSGGMDWDLYFYGPPTAF